ncbi:hypothetical protein [Enterobacter cloacae complex sp. 288G10]|uniref:hypothetical protein n=1 Tax=Enterobacter cloacae complex sp. 288G10 TaxID=3395859 RepID=UPI003CF42565
MQPRLRGGPAGRSGAGKVTFWRGRDTAHNRRMAEPQFRLVQEANVLHIDFLWSLHCFNPRPFRAIELYRQVWEGGALELPDYEPAMQPVPRTPMPAPRWMKLPEGRIGTSFDGLVRYRLPKWPILTVGRMTALPAAC